MANGHQPASLVLGAEHTCNTNSSVAAVNKWYWGRGLGQYKLKSYKSFCTPAVPWSVRFVRLACCGLYGFVRLACCPAAAVCTAPVHLPLSPHCAFGWGAILCCPLHSPLLLCPSCSQICWCSRCLPLQPPRAIVQPAPRTGVCMGRGLWLTYLKVTERHQHRRHVIPVLVACYTQPRSAATDCSPASLTISLAAEARESAKTTCFAMCAAATFSHTPVYRDTELSM